MQKCWLMHDKYPRPCLIDRQKVLSRQPMRAPLGHFRDGSLRLAIPAATTVSGRRLYHYPRSALPVGADEMLLAQRRGPKTKKLFRGLRAVATPMHHQYPALTRRI